ncbi:MAG: aminotransferase class IV, partial [Candidatus Thermoplasmatota archaeon]|nr:aminotransferase class IV [Candidatus Thermoplasmatota archaeon]
MDNETWVWLDGEIVKYSEATVPILTHSLQYGSGIFEGIRSYNTGTSASIFRLGDHVDRFFRSMKIYSMKTSFTKEEIVTGIKDVISVNKLTDAYIRPFAFYNDDRIGLGTRDKKISIYIAAVPYKSYFS